MGSDFIGEEINDIRELKPVIEELVKFVVEEDPEFTIRIHAGENDSLRDNVAKSIEIVMNATPKGAKIPKVRIGHGLYIPDLDSEKGKKLIENLKKSGAIVEFQLTSNIRLNNLNGLENHPLKRYIEKGIRCVQGTDGCGFYGTDTIDEQLALYNLIGLDDKDFERMKEVEKEVIAASDEDFKVKMAALKKLANGKSILPFIVLEILLSNLINNKNETKKYISIMIIGMFIYTILFDISNIFINCIFMIVFGLLTNIMTYTIIKGEDVIDYHIEYKDLKKENEIRKSLFKISHEIKNPLAVIKAYVDIFDYNNSVKSKKYINIISGEIDKMLILLQDFLLVNKDNMCGILEKCTTSSESHYFL